MAEVPPGPRRVSLRDLRAVYDPEMHVAMLRDSPRHHFYAACMAKHRAEIAGGAVIDVGAGCGVLSALAFRHGGAGDVHAVEALPEMGRLIPKILSSTLTDDELARLKVHCGFIEDICKQVPSPLPSQAAALVSEWLGVMALNEGMVCPLLHCRDALQGKPRMIPGGLRLWLQLATAAPPDAIAGRCGPVPVPASVLLGKPVLLLEANLQQASFDELFESSKASLRIPHAPAPGECAAEVHGLVGWFDLFCCAEHPDLVLATGPEATLTHWQQCWMPFQQPLASGEFHVGLRLASDYDGPGLVELVADVQVQTAGTSRQSCFFLDSGTCRYFDDSDTQGPKKRLCTGNDGDAATERKSTAGQTAGDEDAGVEVHYFASDIASLQELVTQAVAEGPGNYSEA